MWTSVARTILDVLSQLQRVFDIFRTGEVFVLYHFTFSEPENNKNPSGSLSNKRRIRPLKLYLLCRFPFMCIISLEIAELRTLDQDSLAPGDAAPCKVQ